MSYEESDSYIEHLMILEKIRFTDVQSPANLHIKNKNRISVTSSVSKSSKNPKASNISCHYCDKNNHNTADCRAIVKFKQQKKSCFEAKAGPGKKSLTFLFEEIKGN
jgi:hypothetical protein